MKNLVAIALALLVLAAAWLGISQVHQAIGSLWLTAYLILCVAFPMLRSVPQIVNGRPGFKQLTRSTMATGGGLLIMTLVQKEVNHDWMWASIAGAIIPAVVLAISGREVAQAKLKAAQAVTLLQNGRTREGVDLALAARTTFVARGDKDAQAEADLLLGTAYSELGEGTRSARYLHSALLRFQSSGKKENASRAELALMQLRVRGVDTETGFVSSEDAGASLRADWMLVVWGIASLTFLGAVIWRWDLPSLHATWQALAIIGAAIFVLLYANYAIFALAAGRARGKAGAILPLILANLSVVAMAAAGLGLALQQSVVEPASFPSAAQSAISSFSTSLANVSQTILIAALAVAAIALFVALLLAAGRSPVGLLGGMFKGDVSSQALDQANSHIDAGEWGPAIRQLSRIDVATLRNAELKKQVLFSLAIAHHHEGHPSEARDLVNELLEIDGSNRDGLYLAGYLAYAEGNLDAAVQSWRRLNSIEPNYPSKGKGATNQSARRYLCLALYRKAMSVMDKDVEEGCRLLAEVGQIGALDKEVADALTRVSLFRCAQAIREHSWTAASKEADQAKKQVEELGSLVTDQDEIRKLRAACQAAAGLCAMANERNKEAIDLFKKASEEIKPLTQQITATDGDSFFEQMLNMLMQQKSGKETVSPNFNRDLHFFAGLAGLRELGKQTAKSATKDWKSQVAVAQKELELSVSGAPAFVEGRAMLGLVYYYLGDGSADQDKGFEILEGLAGRVSSKLVTKTLEDHKIAKKRRADARQAYFELLQQYLQFSDVPRDQRERLRSKVIDRMKADGQYEEFAGRGGLEIIREEQPTVQEYARRTELLRTKINDLITGQGSTRASAALQKLIEKLNTENVGLQNAANEIKKLEQQILQAAQEYV
jgi:tetratricopeptide (TPR) repeat protein